MEIKDKFLVQKHSQMIGILGLQNSMENVFHGKTLPRFQNNFTPKYTKNILILNGSDSQ